MLTLDQIRASLGHKSFIHTPTMWLDTKSRYLNSVLGREDLGIPYGRMIELTGMESNGKTAMGLTIGAIAQRDGAVVSVLDLESSWDSEWASRRGLDAKKVQLLQPYVGKFAKEKDARLISSQELFEEAERVMSASYAEAQAKKRQHKMFMLVDSIAAILTDEESAAGLADSNMRSKLSTAVFLGQLMRRWVGLCQSYNVLVVFINQMRINPMQFFGDPHYTPGGNAPRFFCHIRAKMRRVKGGRMTNLGKVIGVKGILQNTKNKVGGVEGTSCGYKLLFDNGKTVFCSEKGVKTDGE